MPSAYAHHRFGTQVIPILPADVRGPILRHRALFYMGLHGPDFLFFHHFLKKTHLFHLGSAYHQMSGQDFFFRACAHLREHPGEDGFAYLHGLLAHYCLDSHCHPLVYEVTTDTGLEHSELETEFDRFLLALDGYKKPHEVNISRYIRLKKEEYAIVAGFYPEISPEDASTCIRNMALAQRLLTIPTTAGHGAVVTFTKLAGGNTAGQVMHTRPNPKCNHLNAKLLYFYEQALAEFPLYLEQLSAHLAYRAPLGDHFTANFDRG